MASEGPATFRPPLRNPVRSLLLGALGGAALGLVASAPPMMAALFGAAAAGLALWIRQLTGLRIVASEERLEVLGGPAPFRATWPDVRLTLGAGQREDGTLQRYALVSDPACRGFAFAELGAGQPCRPITGMDGKQLEIVSLSESALLLALVVQRTPVWAVFPEPLLSTAAVAPVIPRAVVDGTAGGEAPRPSLPTLSATPRYGVWGLVVKLGGKMLGALAKLGAGTVKAVKTANVGWALLSAASYSIFSWKFGLAIMLQLFVHEYGHVYAMRRTGMKVKGMYFIPFLGALSVTEDAFTSRRQQAYVSLSGPIWGSVFTLLPLGLYAWTRQPIFATVATWWAAINLFNLLPIVPLDGGRAMQAFAYSFSSSVGLVVSLLGLGVVVVLAFVLKMSLVYFVAMLGAMELVGESQGWTGIRAMRLLPEAGRFSLEHFVYLRSALGPPAGSPSEPFFLRRLILQGQAARNAPMRPRQVILWGVTYAALAVGLLLLVQGMSHVPGGDMAARLLH
jgi:Zn-dependent protease